MNKLPNFERCRTALEYCCLNGYSNKFYNEYIYKAISYHGTRFKKLYTVLNRSQLEHLDIDDSITLDLMNLHTDRSVFTNLKKDTVLIELSNAYGLRPSTLIPELPESLVISFGKFKLIAKSPSLYKFDSYGKSITVDSIKSEKVFSMLTKELNKINQKSKAGKQIDFSELRERLEVLK